jgi:mannobiose 2-epimerase
MQVPKANDRAAVVLWFDQALRKHVLPYWCRTAPDHVHGGYRLNDRNETLKGACRRRLGQVARRLAGWPRRPDTGSRKYVITQARMVYGLSLTHRLGYAEDSDALLRAAEIGYRFLTTAMLDPARGGLYAVAERDGTIVDSRKMLVGQAFGIYGLVEYFRASGDRGALAVALELYHAVQRYLHDPIHGGWIEHADPEFQPLSAAVPGPGVVGLPDHKSADAHLHWMEALSELAEATRDREVMASLDEAVRLNRTHFFSEPESGCGLLTRDWRRPQGSRFARISYGHLLEFAWLMIRAQQVLGSPLAWDQFDSILSFVLLRGIDRARGGVFHMGYADGRQNDTRKTWWSQAEAISAFSDALVHRPNPEYAVTLDAIVGWVLGHHIRSADRVWISMVDEAGRPLDRTKSGEWKAAYHDVRAMTKYITAFRQATVT